MKGEDPVDLMFTGMEKLGPGSNEQTLRVLHLLPRQRDPVIVDAGCGTGYQTIALAEELRVLVHAVDSHRPFLNELMARARSLGVASLVEVHCMDLKDIPCVFPQIDLLWSEGAAYNIGFSNALNIWASAIKPGGFAVVSELCWLRHRRPKAAVDYWRFFYADMKSIQQNVQAAQEAGYRLLKTHTLPREGWINGYYDVLVQRANALALHTNPAVRTFAEQMLREIRVFEISEASYGYVFFVLERC